MQKPNIPLSKRSWWQPPKYYGFKVLSILLAVAVWVYVTDTNNPLSEGLFTVPVELRGLSSDLATPETNYQVQVRFQGATSVINSLRNSSIVAYVDLSGAEAGELSPAIVVDPPEDVILVSLSPSSIELNLESKVSQEFPLVAKVSGEPASSFRMLDDSILLAPEMITLSGTADSIAAAAEVFVNADVSGLESSYDRNLSIGVLDANGNNISDWFDIKPATANVVVPIVFEQPEATVAVRAQTSGQPAVGYQVSGVTVLPSTVRAFSDLATLNSITSLSTATVDVSGLRKTTSFTGVAILHNNNVSLSQETATVVVEIAPVSSVEFTRDLLTVENLAPGLSINLPTMAVTVVASGPDVYTAAAAETDIVPYVDCAGITEAGEYTLKIQVSLPGTLSLVSANPGDVAVTIDAEALPETDGEESPEETEPPAEAGATE